MNRHRVSLWTAVTLGLLSLGGCASAYEGKYEFSDGWRKATVVSIVSGSEVKNPRFWDCLRRAPEAERLSRTYVLLDYHNMNRHRKRIVPAPADMRVLPGEKVYLNLSTCEQSLAKRSALGQG